MSSPSDRDTLVVPYQFRGLPVGGTGRSGGIHLMESETVVQGIFGACRWTHEIK